MSLKHCGMCGDALTGGGSEIGHQRQRCQACGWAWYNPPVPVTLVLVTTDDGQVVYTRKRSFEPGRWSVVSGFIPCGERAEDAAVREVKEETGLDVEIVRFMGTHVYPNRQEQIVIAFHARVTGGVLCAQDDIDEAEIAPPDPSRLRAGSTSHWLVSQLLTDSTSKPLDSATA